MRVTDYSVRMLCATTPCYLLHIDISMLATVLAGIVNNAGIGFGRSALDCVNTNTLGAKRMFDSFLPLLQSEGSIANVCLLSCHCCFCH